LTTTCGRGFFWQINQWVSQLADLREARNRFRDAGVEAGAELAFGDPVTEIVRWVNEHECDLVAMSTHGHKWLADLVLGETATKVQHNVSVPVLLIRAI